MTEKEFKDHLIIGAKIEIGPEYAKRFRRKPGLVITLVKGYFEYDNGLYESTQTAPSEKRRTRDGVEYNSIYHLFGNKFEDFMDCKIIFSPLDDYLTGQVDAYFNDYTAT